MYHPRHARPHHYIVPVVVAALVVLGALGFGVTLDGDRTTPSDNPETMTTTGSQSPSANDAVPAASKGPSAIDRCRAQYDAQAPVLRTAARSIEQWEVHVRAMNQLVAGEITLDQASDFWNRTRMGAQRRVTDFRDAERAYTAGDHNCPSPQAADATSLRTCGRSVLLRDEVLTVARRAIDTWAMHVRDMERLRDGQLSPAKAAEMWRMSWHMGQHQIDAYHDALRKADRADACTA